MYGITVRRLRIVSPIKTSTPAKCIWDKSMKIVSRLTRKTTFSQFSRKKKHDFHFAMGGSQKQKLCQWIVAIEWNLEFLECTKTCQCSTIKCN